MDSKEDKLHKLADVIWEVAKRWSKDEDIDWATSRIKELSSEIHYHASYKLGAENE